MALPRGGKPARDITRAAGITAFQFVPVSQFNGGLNSPWQPANATHAITYLWYVQKWLPEYATNFRVLWSTANVTTSNSITPRIRYKTLVPDTTAVAIATTVLSTAIVADNPTATANSLMKTAAGVLNAGTSANGDALVLTLDVPTVSGITLGATASDNVNIYGLEIEFVVGSLD